MDHPVPKPHTILLADDEANLRTLVRTTLEREDCRILEAANGTIALDLAQRERPDVVVLDIMMPGMTGLEVLRCLRREPGTATIPVVVLTATGQEKDRERALERGADAYLVKPFSPLELPQTVEVLRDRAEARAARSSSCCHPSVRAVARAAKRPTWTQYPAAEAPSFSQASIARAGSAGPRPPKRLAPAAETRRTEGSPS